ncbi:helix-turn-helix transcriptional regulator [Morganella morganii]|uniref:helix-turn-helix transcriptional regulator n=1 Tax=Morganella morganii TaxID=582 RepID=UPI0004690ABB|nr:AlpA family phage regulatory protein [Morganella morganii]
MSDSTVILRVGDMVKKLKIARSTLYDWLNRDSPRYNTGFPRPFRLSGKSIGWDESEVNDWLIQRKKDRC